MILGLEKEESLSPDSGREFDDGRATKMRPKRQESVGKIFWEKQKK